MIRQVADQPAAENEGSLCLHVGRMRAHLGVGEMMQLPAVGVGPHNEAMGLDLPQITADILGRLRAILDASRWLTPSDPVSFQYQLNGKWREDSLI